MDRLLRSDRDGELQADAISWSAEPDDRLEDRNLLLLEDDELLAYVAALRQDLRIMRALLSEALTAIQRQSVQADRCQRRIGDLLGALRLARADVAALRAQLQAIEDPAA
jgi:hypothetical protein